MSVRRWIAVLCCVMLVSSIAAGCASKGDGTPAATEQKNTPASSAKPAEVVETKSAKPLSLSVEVFDRGDAPAGSTADNNPITKWIIKEAKEKLNVDVAFVPVPRAQQYDKLNIMLASNSAPDISYVNESTVVKGYAKNGGLADLGSYLNKFGADIKKLYGDEILSLGQLDGKQYWLPGKREVAAIHVTYIRKDWVEKLGATIPKTKAEFYSLLKRFKEEDPGKVGKDKVIPYAFGGKAREAYYESFVMSYAESDKKNNAIYSGILKQLTPGTKEAYKILNQWYNEGLISKDWPLDTSDKQFIQDITTGVAGAFTMDTTEFFGSVDVFTKNVPGGKFWPIATFEHKTTGNYYIDGDLGQGLKLMVPKANEKNAEAAVRYLNWMSNMKNLTNIRYGLEGVCFNYDADGIPEYIGNIADRNAKGITDTMFGDLGIIVADIDFGSAEKNSKAFLKIAPKNHLDLAAELYKVARAPGLYRRYDFTAPLEAETNYGANLKSAMRAASPKIITAKVSDFEKVYEDEIKKVMEGGAKAIIDERTAAYK